MAFTIVSSCHRGGHRRALRFAGARMRPDVLNPLFAAITSLPGIGSRLEKLYQRLLGRDDVPRVIARRARPKLRDVRPDTVVTVVVTVDRHRPAPPRRPRAPYQIYTSDET